LSPVVQQRRVEHIFIHRCCTHSLSSRGLRNGIDDGGGSVLCAAASGALHSTLTRCAIVFVCVACGCTRACMSHAATSVYAVWQTVSGGWRRWATAASTRPLAGRCATLHYYSVILLRCVCVVSSVVWRCCAGVASADDSSFGGCAHDRPHAHQRVGRRAEQVRSPADLLHSVGVHTRRTFSLVCASVPVLCVVAAVCRRCERVWRAGWCFVENE